MRRLSWTDHKCVIDSRVPNIVPNGSNTQEKDINVVEKTLNSRWGIWVPRPAIRAVFRRVEDGDWGDTTSLCEEDAFCLKNVKGVLVVVVRILLIIDGANRKKKLS